MLTRFRCMLLLLIGIFSVSLLGSVLIIAVLSLPSNRDVIAFTNRLEQTRDIFLIDLRIRVMFNLTRTPYDEERPVWSPDGHYLAYISTIEAVPHVFVIQANGKNMLWLKPPGNEPEGVQYRLHRAPVWMPDNRHLVFVRVGLPGNPSVFYRADVSTEEVEIIAQGDTDAQYYLNTSQFVNYPSPDGTQVLYYTFSSDTDEWTLYLDEDNRSRLLHRFLRSEVVPGDIPVWSPDGAKIAFSLIRGGVPQIHVMDARGGVAFPITTNGGTNPLWQPDGQVSSAPDMVSITPRPIATLVGEGEG